MWVWFEVSLCGCGLDGCDLGAFWLGRLDAFLCGCGLKCVWVCVSGLVWEVLSGCGLMRVYVGVAWVGVIFVVFWLGVAWGLYVGGVWGVFSFNGCGLGNVLTGCGLRIVYVGVAWVCVVWCGWGLGSVYAGLALMGVAWVVFWLGVAGVFLWMWFEVNLSMFDLSVCGLRTIYAGEVWVGVAEWVFMCDLGCVSIGWGLRWVWLGVA